MGQVGVVFGHVGIDASTKLSGRVILVDIDVVVFDCPENLVMIAKLRHINHPRQVADDLLKRFGLTDAADRKTSTYSGGMRRRLDIAMSLVGKLCWRKIHIKLGKKRAIQILFEMTSYLQFSASSNKSMACS